MVEDYVPRACAVLIQAVLRVADYAVYMLIYVCMILTVANVLLILTVILTVAA